MSATGLTEAAKDAFRESLVEWSLSDRLTGSVAALDAAINLIDTQADSVGDALALVRALRDAFAERMTANPLGRPTTVGGGEGA